MLDFDTIYFDSLEIFQTEKNAQKLIIGDTILKQIIATQKVVIDKDQWF